MPCGVAFAEDAFMATGAVFEPGGLLCSFSIAFSFLGAALVVAPRAAAAAGLRALPFMASNGVCMC